MPSYAPVIATFSKDAEVSDQMRFAVSLFLLLGREDGDRGDRAGSILIWAPTAIDFMSVPFLVKTADLWSREAPLEILPADWMMSEVNAGAMPFAL